MEQDLIGRYCMVRTESAGVFAGTVKELYESKAMLTDARRIWYWAGAASLSQLSTFGTSKPKQCKFPVPVKEVYLTNVIEIIPITEIARKNIEGVPIWKE
jgi:hypothetical protein